jgi:A/G-specific adenine glycosylase
MEFRRRLLGWFDGNARDLPWRRSRDPYAIWVSEIMLQQTRVAAVLEHYVRFMERFPQLDVLAAASEDEVLAHWSGLGYYRRARMLHRAAQFVAEQLGGQLPPTAMELRTLPGVGEYTCAAIASIGFGEAVACVDGNVERVLRRVRGWDERSGTAAKIRTEAARLLDPERAGDFNQAMMELGATVCLPRGPLCLQCPVREMCETKGEHPVAERKKMRSKELAYAFLQREAKAHTMEVMLEQRAASMSLMPGMWELPAINAKHVAEEKKALTLRHSITDTNYYVTIYEVAAEEQSQLLPKRKAARGWFAVDELHTLALTGLTRKALKRLRVWPGFSEAGPVVAFGKELPEILL